MGPTKPEENKSSYESNLRAQISALTAEVERLRKALIQTGRNVGAGLTDEVTTDFICEGVPEEVRRVVERLKAENAEHVHFAGALATELDIDICNGGKAGNLLLEAVKALPDKAKAETFRAAAKLVALELLEPSPNFGLLPSYIEKLADRAERGEG